MTPLALRAQAASARPALRLFRAPLAFKLAIAFLGLVALVLIVNGAVDTYLTYNQAKRAALEVESEKARGAAEKVGAFLTEIVNQLGWTAGVEWGYAKLEQQRYDFVRLLRQTPAITALSYIDGHGREQIAVSRLEPDSIATGKDLSADLRFARAVADKVWFGPVEFRRGSEPYMTIAVAHVGKSPGVTVAEVNLKLVWDVINAIHVGGKGFAYVVDRQGRLIAHPDLSLVLRDTDFSRLPQVADALKRQDGDEAESLAGAAEIAKSFDGGAVLTAYAIAPKTHWAVFVEQPISEALAVAYGALVRALSLLGLGLALAAVSGIALARRMAAPIQALQAGAEKLGAGDLALRLDIRTGDEIEALAGGFNQMAARLQESYENLEGKVEARTRDLNEALERRTATAEILRVIAASPSDMQPVFEVLADRAMQLLGAWSVAVFRFDGELLHIGATRGGLPDSEALLRAMYPRRPLAAQAYADCIAQKAPVAVIDEWASADPVYREYSKKRGFRSHLTAPMLANGEVIGLISATRKIVGAFSEEDSQLLTSFADQAAIAIRNVALFNETQEALAQQTATADVLKTISRSAFDLQAVLDTLVASAVRLFGADNGIMYLQRGEAFFVGAAYNTEEFGKIVERLRERPHFPGRGSVGARVLLTGEMQHVPDIRDDAEYDPTLRAASVGRSVLGVPMKRESVVSGAIVFVRRQPEPFSTRHIEIAQTFADQAVIAIENARLFEEVQARTREVEEALAQQTATADVLKTISRSAFNTDAVLRTLIDTAVRLCSAERGTIWLIEGDLLAAKAFQSNLDPGRKELLTAHPRRFRTQPGPLSDAARSGSIVNIVGGEVVSGTLPVEFRTIGDIGALLVVPLRSTETLGVFSLTRQSAVAFTKRDIELVQTFADQAVIAIENARLFEEVQSRTRELEQSLSDLRKAQDRLVQSEKLASLGQLTAGIAHEIKNPLNFVNNFATLSRELLEELREPLARLPEEARTDADELMDMIGANLEKVAAHGKRADSIVKNMLLHSREGSGERAKVNINAMVEEALNLGYHGARAEKPGFNVTIGKALDPAAGDAELYLQEVTRVLLNLISNGFYASAKRGLAEGAAYQPMLRASTRDLGHSVEIRIRDNGTGIPEDVRAKMFNPFFTTKPAGEGTGLGLSLSHDIVVKQHGGTLDVETEPGAFTEFVITLPREGVKA